MNIVHLSVPGSFTFTVPEYQMECARKLRERGLEFHHYDLTTRFWRYALGSTRFERFIDSLQTLELSHLREIGAHLTALAAETGTVLELSKGLVLPEDVRVSTHRMMMLISSGYGQLLLGRWFDEICDELNLRSVGLVSLGIINHESFFLGLLLASHIRKRLPTIPVVIGHHNYENFSLLFYIEQLRNSPVFDVLDGIVLREEYMAEAFVSFAKMYINGGTPENMAVRGAKGVILADVSAEWKQRRLQRRFEPIPSTYFAFMQVPVDKVMYRMSMVRNKCFYHKCTFCMQIARHMADEVYIEGTEIERCLDTLGHLQEQGVALVIFDDEAMSAKNLRRFCAEIQRRRICMHWIGRMIAAVHVDQQLLHLMAQAGCREVLFGLETVVPRVARILGKVSARTEKQDVWEMLEKYDKAGISIILSTIHSSPTETPAEAQETSLFLLATTLRFGSITVIRNQFTLFREAAIARNPALCSITTLSIPPGNDLQDYLKYYPSVLNLPLYDDKITYRREINLAQKASICYGASALTMLRHLEYTTWGLQYYIHSGRRLMSDVLRKEMNGTNMGLINGPHANQAGDAQHH